MEDRSLANMRTAPSGKQRAQHVGIEDFWTVWKKANQKGIPLLKQMCMLEFARNLRTD
jgi:hypothetical protein